MERLEEEVWRLKGGKGPRPTEGWEVVPLWEAGGGRGAWWRRWWPGAAGGGEEGSEVGEGGKEGKEGGKEVVVAGAGVSKPAGESARAQTQTVAGRATA